MLVDLCRCIKGSIKSGLILNGIDLDLFLIIFEGLKVNESDFENIIGKKLEI